MCGDDQLAAKAKAASNRSRLEAKVAELVVGGREVKGPGWHSVAMQDRQPGESTP